MSYAAEFNADDYNVPDLLLEDPWEDESWHNDLCPRFTEGTVTVWVSEINPDLREVYMEQYVVIDSEDDIIFSSDDVDQLIDFLS